MKKVKIEIELGKHYQIMDYEGNPLPKDFVVTPRRKVNGPPILYECLTSNGGILHVRPYEFIAEVKNG